MMSPRERQEAIRRMRAASGAFYAMATQIGNHPFIEFAGLMNEYIQACERAAARGIDFSNCSAHSGQDLPLMPWEINYINEKLECIYTGRIALREDDAA